MFRKIVCFLVFCGFLCVRGNEYPECNGQPTGSILPVSNNCSLAIRCNGAYSDMLHCSEELPHFSIVDLSCHNNISVCDNRSYIENQKPTPPTIATTNLVTQDIPKFTTNYSPILSITAAKASNTTFSNIPTTIEPLSSITTPSTISYHKPTTLSATENSTTLLCPPVNDPSRPLFLPHPKSCSQYYLCRHGAAIVMHCPNMLHFDVIQQSCNTIKQANCQLSGIELPDQCPSDTIMVYPHPSNCSYYYRCNFGYLMIMQCAFGMGWDYEMRVCVAKSKVKCYKNNH